MNNYKPFHIEGEIWINKDQDSFISSGRLLLLNKIVEEGSINSASKVLKISYQHAWKSIEQMNRISPLPLIIPQRGGKDGGGTLVTEYGKSLIEQLNAMNLVFNEFINYMNNKYSIACDSRYPFQ